MQIPGAPTTEYQATNPVAPGMTKQSTSYAYNGFLNAYSASGVASPSSLPVLTAANGYGAQLGWGFANPALNCPQPNTPCVYQPYSSSCSGSTNGQQGYIYTTIGGGAAALFVNGQGQNFALTDTHAKWRTLGGSGNTNYNVDPWTGYDATGHAGYYWWDGCHAWLFRPDYVFPN
jgi:hypothetical protein